MSFYIIIYLENIIITDIEIKLNNRDEETGLNARTQISCKQD